MEVIKGLIAYGGAGPGPGREGQPADSVREDRQEEERKQIERQTGGRDDAGDDDDLERDSGG